MVPARIGNLYDPDFDTALTPRPCPLAQCRCHIGFREGSGRDCLSRRFRPL
jgi:hypothetical protein